jgi:hypothetical protein
MSNKKVNISKEALNWMFAEQCVDWVNEFKETIVYCDNSDYVKTVIKKLGGMGWYSNIVQMRWLYRYLEGLPIEDYYISCETDYSVDSTHNIWCGKKKTQIQEQCERNKETDPTLQVRVYNNMCDGWPIYDDDFYAFDDDDNLRDEIINQLTYGEYYGDEVKAFYNGLMDLLMKDMVMQLEARSNIAA